MAIIGRLDNGYLLVEESVAGPASYDSGARPAITFDDLSQNVEAVLGIFSDDGRIADQQGLAGRILTFRVRGNSETTADNAGLAEVGDTTDLSGSTYRALAYGR
jgi:hypothetical protein